MSEESVHAVYRGVVQGVGFRFTACNIAKRHRVRGWVSNMADGGVELTAQGLRQNIKLFLDDLGNEFKNSISDVNIASVSLSKKFSEFQIRF